MSNVYQSKPSDGNIHRQKPIRFRAACNQCNSAKVKCSGEKTGCSRCINIEAECIYIESRVGKIQGIKKRRRGTLPAACHRPQETSMGNSAINLTSPVHCQDVPSTVQPTNQDWPPENLPWENDNLLNLEDPIMIMDEIRVSTRIASASSSMNDSNMFLCESPDPRTRLLSTDNGPIHSTNSPQSSTDISNKSSSSNSNDRVGLINPASLTCSIPWTAQPTPIPDDPVSSEQLLSNARLESKCILTLTNMAATLEGYLLDGLAVLDLIISTSRSIAQTLRKLVTYQQELRSERLMFMFITVLNQLATLVDIATRRAYTPTHYDKHNEQRIGSVSSHSSSFQSSAHEVDDAEFSVPQFNNLDTWSVFNDEEQWSWRMYALSKECQNVEEIAIQISVSANMELEVTADPSLSHFLFAGLLKKLRALGEKACSRGKVS